VPRSVSTSGFMHYNSPVVEAPAQQPSSSPAGPSATQGMLQEYGGIAKHALNPSSTGIAEGYNRIYDFATGFDSAAVPGTNLATETSSSGTFGGSNISNAAYGYAGGKVANELFDNKGYSDMGGTLGASLGASVAVGGSAIGVSMGATYGALAGPVGAIAGAVLGAALGSIMGSSPEDYRFRTYSGELGEDSALNTDQMAEKAADWESIRTQNRAFYTNPDKESNPEAYDRWVASGDYSKNTSSAYKWLKEGNTFTIGDKWDTSQGDYKRAIDNDYAGFDGAFGKYTVGHIDDIPGRTKFAQVWVDAIEEMDAAVASILTPEQVAASKEGLKGSIQGTADWHNKSGQIYGTDAMIFDRYAAIFELAGRDDLAEQLVTGMDRSISGTAEYRDSGGEGDRQRIIPLLAEILRSQSSSQAQSTVVERAPVTISAQPTEPAATAQPVQAAPQIEATSNREVVAQAETPRNTEARQPQRTRQRITIRRPEGKINPAMRLNYA